MNKKVLIFGIIMPIILIGGGLTTWMLLKEESKEPVKGTGDEEKKGGKSNDIKVIGKPIMDANFVKKPASTVAKSKASTVTKSKASNY